MLFPFRSSSTMGAPWWRWSGRIALRSPATAALGSTSRPSLLTSRGSSRSTKSSTSASLASPPMPKPCKLTSILDFTSSFAGLGFLYQLREERDMKPQTFASLVSALLYEKSRCLLVCRELAKDFVVSGTASESLYGACESMYKPNMDTNRSAGKNLKGKDGLSLL
ncbi:hypothetical protein BHE74_00038121 [Ensete ventricosum]|nr:hypothetical protein BHE74_00038121 [Ensete ventricosum]